MVVDFQRGINPDAAQACWRWLVPVTTGKWIASATGKRIHYAPGATIERGIYNWARCGTGVSMSRDSRLRRDGRIDALFPCQRCMDSLACEASTSDGLRDLREQVTILRRATQRLVNQKKQLLRTAR